MSRELTISHFSQIPVQFNLWDYMQKLIRQSPAFSALTLFMLLSIVPKLSMMTFDERLHNDINIWIKPIKFDVALVMFLATLIIFAQWIDPKTRQKLWFKAFNGLVVGAIIFEIVWINGAAAAGTSSHFNLTSPIMGMAYSIAGMAAVTLTSGALVYGILIARNKKSGLSDDMHFAIWSSSVLMFILTVITASYMAAQTSHFVGGNLSDLEAIPILGWATDGGDLRVAHFFASHIFHVIPLMVFGAGLMVKSLSRSVILVATAIYTGFTFYTLYEAMQGVPFLGLLLA